MPTQRPGKGSLLRGDNPGESVLSLGLDGVNALSTPN